MSTRTGNWSERARSPRNGSIAAGIALITALFAVPATANAAPPEASGQHATAHSVTAGALTTAYTGARNLPPSAVARIPAGSLHVASVSGTSWAIATFLPSAHTSARITNRFQGGGGTGVFTRSAGHSWRLVRTGPYGCGQGLPAALQHAWGLGRSPACQAPAASQRTAAISTLSETRADSAADSLGHRIARIALSQIGTGDTPVSTDFSLDCNPYSSLVAGFSANANGCGVDQAHHVRTENEEWCADFAKWVWEQAGVTADLDTLNAGAVSFYQWALDQGESPQADTGTPAIGDAVVFFSPGAITPTTYAVHVGLVTAVHPDGTVDMANGDFEGTDNIRVEYDTDIDLTSFAAQIYGAGEQWVLVTPTPAQHPAPSARIAGPRTAVSGTAAEFSVHAREPGGSITGYYWTFGDGRLANTTGPQVSHVFAGTGIYPVSVTVTSSFGTARTVVQNVDVLGASSAVASVPSTAVWFASTPIDQYQFVRSSSGALAVNIWDGASWLQETAAGQVAADSGLTALAYPDPAANDATSPHAYFRSAPGTLAQTFLGNSGWTTQPLVGKPAPGSAIVAATTPDGGVAVFYATADGRLAETAGQGASWTTATLPGPRTTDPGTLALATTVSGPRLLYLAGHGRLVVASPGWTGRDRRGAGLVVAMRAAADTPLAAVSTDSGDVRAFFVDRDGQLAMAAVPGHGRPPGVRTLPGSPTTTSLAATSYLLPSGTGPVINGLPTALPSAATGEEVFYLGAGGQPAATYTADGTWRTATLPGEASGIAGADAYQVAAQPSELFLTGGAGPAVDSAATPAGPWTSTVLPAAPASFADRVLLYAATDADRQVAAQAASAAGLPAGQVTRSYASAWDATLSGNYLVITVGGAATTALYYNVCGWANPSTDIPGSTPFYIAASPLDQLPGADAFENGSAADAAQSLQRATDLAFYAVNGQYPAGVTSLPAAGHVQYACSGTPS